MLVNYLSSGVVGSGIVEESTRFGARDGPAGTEEKRTIGMTGSQGVYREYVCLFLQSTDAGISR